MTWPARLAAVLVALAGAAATGCGDDRGEQQLPGGELGGNAKVVTLARAPLGSRPSGASAWNAWRVELAPGDKLQHTHALSTVYAEKGPHSLKIASDKKTLKPEGGAIVAAGRPHTHEAGDEPSIFWDVLLDTPGAKLPKAVDAKRVFETERLEGIPEQAEVAFLEVILAPRGGQTTVHTHPGPETIYVTSGPFKYQNAREGSSTVDDGDVKSIPPATPVQKRNPRSGRSRFLSWFIVDPAKDFAPASEFPSSG